MPLLVLDLLENIPKVFVLALHNLVLLEGCVNHALTLLDIQ